MSRKLAAEFVGTFCLIFFGVGSAVFGITTIGYVGVALTFGLLLVALVYTIGPVSGCHVNPAVTLGVVLAGRMRAGAGLMYWVAQFAGAIAATSVLKLFTSSFGQAVDQTGTLGANGFGPHVNQSGAFLLEVALTFLLVFVVLMVTGRATAPGFAGLAIGLALTVTNLVGIPIDGASVNPARSLGPALLVGGSALGQVWVFLIAPLVGALVATAVWRLLVAEQPDVSTR